MSLASIEVSDQFWYGRTRTPGIPDSADSWELYHDNWHVWCGCPL